MTKLFTFWDKFLVQDARTLEIMKDFPLEKFRSNPVAYLPMEGGTGGGIAAAIYSDGSVASVKPTVFEVVDVDPENEEQEQFLAAGAATFEGELAVCVWDSTAQKYAVNFYKTKKYTFEKVGSAPLTPPNPEEILCGFAHAGGSLVCVWLSGNLQVYGPRVNKLMLLQDYRLAGFDFKAMGNRSRTEDLRTLPLGISVCTRLGEKDLVLVAGPAQAKNGLKFVTIETRTGIMQAGGVLFEKEPIDAPVKILMVDFLFGRIRTVLGGKDLGESIVQVRANSFASRLGSLSMHPDRKRRKLNVSSEQSTYSPLRSYMDQSKGTNFNCRDKPPLSSFCLPAWTQKLNNSKELTEYIEKRMGGSETRKGSAKTGEQRICAQLDPESLESDVSDLMDTLTLSKPTVKSVEQSLKLLAMCKYTQIVLIVDLVGMTAGAILKLENKWENLRKLLEISPLRSLRHCPTLLSEVVNASQFRLLDKIIVSLDTISGEELKTILQAIFGSTASTLGRIDHYDLESSSVLADLKGAELSSGGDLQKCIPYLQRRVACVDGFSPSELLLHSVLQGHADSLALSEAFKDLTPNEACQLFEYLGKWVKKQLLLVPEVDHVGQPDTWSIPDRDNVVAWMSVLITCQMAAISRNQNLHKVGDCLLLDATTLSLSENSQVQIMLFDYWPLLRLFMTTCSLVWTRWLICCLTHPQSGRKLSMLT